MPRGSLPSAVVKRPMMHGLVMLPGHLATWMEAQAAVFGHLIDVDAAVGEVRDRALPERRCLAPDRFGPIKVALLVLVAVALLRLRRRRWLPSAVAGERCDCAHEVAPVDMLNEFDDVAAAVPTTVKDLLPNIDGESISAAARGASPNKLGALPLKLNATTPDLIFDWYAACVFDVRGAETDSSSHRPFTRCHHRKRQRSLTCLSPAAT